MEPTAKNFKDFKYAPEGPLGLLQQKNIVNLWLPDGNGLLFLCLHAVTVWGLQEGFLSARKSEDPPA